MATEADKAAAKLGKERPKLVINPRTLLHTGSTLLNMAFSSHPRGGIPPGSYVFFVGDSVSGKTWLALSAFAEAARNKHYANYRFIHDNVERGALMDLTRFFGAATAGRIEAPHYDKDGNPEVSFHIDDFFFNLDDALDHEQPCIYILDSMDALSSDYETKKFRERKAAHRKGPAAVAKLKGDFGDGKAKRNSSGMRQMLHRLEKTGSILIVICQTRDNIDALAFEPQETRSGGRSLRFYATVEMWTKPVKRLKKSVREKDRQVGIITRAVVKKNRITGKEWTVEIPIYNTYGVDDLGSCVDYLVDEKHWKKTKEGGTITAPEFDYVGSRDKLIRKIEAEDKERALRSLVGEVWAEIEEAMQLKRKPRYE